MAKAIVTAGPNTGVDKGEYEGAATVDVELGHLFVQDREGRTLSTWAPGAWALAVIESDDTNAPIAEALFQFAKWLNGVPTEDRRSIPDLVADFLVSRDANRG